MKINSDINIIGSIPDYHLIYMALPLLLTNQVELENILVTKYGPPESVQKAIKVSYENAVINNLGRGQLLKNDREIITNGLINLYNQNCGRIVAIPQAVYVWSV